MPKTVVLAVLILATTSGAAGAASCADARGAEAADILVQRCTEVSPATHPPCNAENACSLILSEIQRGCAMLSGRDRPGYCDDY